MHLKISNMLRCRTKKEDMAPKKVAETKLLYLGATKLTYHNYWTYALESVSHSYWTYMLAFWNLSALEQVLPLGEATAMRSPCTATVD